MKVKELLTDESKWTKYKVARDEKGSIVPLTDKRASMWCLLGAIWKCYKEEEVLTIEEKVLKEIRRRGFTSVDEWNDTRDFSEVKELVEKLDI